MRIASKYFTIIVEPTEDGRYVAYYEEIGKKSFRSYGDTQADAVNELTIEEKVPAACICIEVEGGVVTSVKSDQLVVANVVVRDLDNIINGDPDPIKNIKKGLIYTLY